MLDVLFEEHHTLEQRHWWFRGRRAAITGLSAELVEPGGCVVDVGCGTGADIASLPRTYRRHGMDRSAGAIAFAQATYPEVSFRVAELPDPAAAAIICEADLILLCDVLEHVEHHHAFLSWLIQALRPGAHLLLTVPADPRLWSPHDETYGHFRRYTRDSLRDAWSAEPVRERLLASFNRRLYPLARASRTVTRLRGRAWGSHSTDLVLPPAPVNALFNHMFAGEAPRLIDSLLGRVRPSMMPGVSLLAVLQRTDPAVISQPLPDGEMQRA